MIKNNQKDKATGKLIKNDLSTRAKVSTDQAELFTQSANMSPS